METTVTLEELARATEDLPLETPAAPTSSGASLATRTPSEEHLPPATCHLPPSAEPSEADIATLTAQYRKAVNGLYEAYKFGQMLLAVKARLEATFTGDDTRVTAREGANGGTIAAGGWNAGSGLKGWLAEHCPDIAYHTARRFLAVAENTNAALALQAEAGDGDDQTSNPPNLQTSPSEEAVKAYLAGKSQRAILRRGGSREGAGRKAKDYAKALDANGEVAWHEIEEPLAALSELIVAQGRHTRLNPADLETLRASIDLIHERVHAEA